MSNKTKATLDSSMFLTTKGSLKVLETVLNFERVNFSKTCENVAKWMESTAKAPDPFLEFKYHPCLLRANWHSSVPDDDSAMRLPQETPKVKGRGKRKGKRKGNGKSNLCSLL